MLTTVEPPPRAELYPGFRRLAVERLLAWADDEERTGELERALSLRAAAQRIEEGR